MDYRLIVLSSSGKAAKIEDWACVSDAEAIRQASQYVSSFGCELWRGDERISTFAGPLSARPAEPAHSPDSQA